MCQGIEPREVYHHKRISKERKIYNFNRYQQIWFSKVKLLNSKFALKFKYMHISQVKSYHELLNSKKYTNVGLIHSWGSRKKKKDYKTFVGLLFANLTFIWNKFKWEKLNNLT